MKTTVKKLTGAILAVVILMISSFVVANAGESADIPDAQLCVGIVMTNAVTTDNQLLSGFSANADGENVTLIAERVDTSTSGYVFYIDDTKVKSIGYGNTYTWTPSVGAYTVKVERYDMKMNVTATMTATITVSEEFFSGGGDDEEDDEFSFEITENGDNLTDISFTIRNEGQRNKYIEVKSIQSGLSMPYNTTFKLDGTVVQKGTGQSYDWSPSKAGEYTFTVTIDKSGFTNQKSTAKVTVKDSYFTGETEPATEPTTSPVTEPEENSGTKPDRELVKGVWVRNFVTTDSDLLSDVSLAAKEQDGDKLLTITAERGDTSVGGYAFYIDGEQVKALGYGYTYDWTPSTGTHSLKIERYNFSMSVVAEITAVLDVQDSFFSGGAMLGDVSGDVVISVADATLVQMHAAEMITLTGDAYDAADTTKDGLITVADATLIQKFAAEMIDSF